MANADCVPGLVDQLLVRLLMEPQILVFQAAEAGADTQSAKLCAIILIRFGFYHPASTSERL